jgi:signal transduction histidine kinase
MSVSVTAAGSGRPQARAPMRRWLPSLRALLIVLVTAAVLPIFLFSAWLMVLQSQREMDAIEDGLLNTAQAVAVDVDREIAAATQSLQMLALGFDSHSARTGEFQELSNRMLSAQEAWRTIVVRDPAGSPLVTVSRSANEARPPGPSQENPEIIGQTDKERNIDSPLAFVMGSAVSVHVPIRVERKVAYLASALLDPRVFAGVLTQHKLSPEWLVSILDSKKVVVASNRFADKLFGKPTPMLFKDAVRSAPGHLFRSNLDNIPSYIVLSAAPVSGWSVVLAAPAALVEAPYYRTVWLIVATGILCVILGGIFAYLLGRRATRSVERLATRVADRGQGRVGEDLQMASLAEVEKINERLEESSDLLHDREQERDRLYEQIKDQLRELTELHELSTSLRATEDRQALFNEIVAGALILLRTDKAALQLMDHTTPGLKAAARIGLGADFHEALMNDGLGDGVVGTAVANRRLLVVEDVEASPSLSDQQRTSMVRAGIRAALALPLMDRRGEVIGALSVYFTEPCRPSQSQELLLDLYGQYCLNVVQQARAREELQILNDSLEQRVKEHESKLEEAYCQRIDDLTKHRELENQLREAQKMELIGTLAGGVAHDFNNILNIILSYASFVEEKDPGGHLAEEVQVIKETVQRGGSLVRQLLSVARKTETKFEPTDLNRVISRVTELLAKTFPKNIIVAVEFDPRIPVIALDGNQITQAIINLSLNARDAMTDGGRLTIAARYLDAATAEQRFSKAKAVPYACVSVSDTGTGIGKEVEEHIFEPFFTTKGRSQGTGLGLSVAHGIIGAHDGFINFITETGRGTTFSFCLPIKETFHTGVNVIRNGQ